MMQQQKRIPNGTILGEIPLEAAKTFDVRIWKGLDIRPRIGYGDWNTNHERNTLFLKFLPDGAKTAQHPQLVMYVVGDYHWEYISDNPAYRSTDPFDWSSRMEVHINAADLPLFFDAIVKVAIASGGQSLKRLIDAAIKAEIAWEALHTSE